MKITRYELKVVQDGTLPLQLDGRIIPHIEHLCTCVVVWPEGMIPAPDNSLIVDPCFSEKSLRKAAKRLQRLNSSIDRIGHVFVTHEHRDHLPNLPGERSTPHWVPFLCDGSGQFRGIRCHPCPGHSPDLMALVLNTKDGEYWIVGDAILNKTWLIHWGYYWPNGYTTEQISQTWCTVADILTKADVIVPGHGSPFRVTASVVEEALANWPAAPHRSRCPDVGVSLQSRLETLKMNNPRIGKGSE